jgi:hypothetical protein
MPTSTTMAQANMRRHDDSLKEHSSLSQCVDKTRRGSPEHWLNQCRLVAVIGQGPVVA